MTPPTIPLTRPSLGPDELAAAARVLSGPQLTQGPEVAWFESDFAAYQSDNYIWSNDEGLPSPLHAVATNACTSALYLTLKAMGIGPGDEVITSPLSWVATALAIRWTGADVVFADVDDQGLLDPERVSDVVTVKTRAIVPVHLYGQVCDIDSFAILSDIDDVSIVYDAAHAIESRYDGAPCGGYGDAACYSFHATKNLTTAGEGGMVVTRHQEVADYVRKARMFGLRSSKDRTCEQFGAKLNMSEVQAAIGRVQLRRIEDRWKLRDALWHAYDAELNAPVRHIIHEPGMRDALHLYAIFTDRDVAREALERAGIGSGIHYRPIYDEPEFAGTKPRFAENADRIGRRTISIPFYPEMGVEDVARVAQALGSVL